MAGQPESSRPAPHSQGDQDRPTRQRLRQRISTVFAWSLLGLFLIWVGLSVAQGGIAYDMIRSDWDAERRVARLREYFDGLGPWAPVAYVGFVSAEVVIAPIPGLMLYAPGGLIFGAIPGGTLALVGNILGAGIACLLARSMGRLCFDGEVRGNDRAVRLQEALHQRGAWLIFLLRLNPLTSSDLLSWVAGLTTIPVWQLMLATGAGMAPLCYLQSWMSRGLFEIFPGLIYPLIVCGIIWLAVVFVILGRLFLSKS